MKLKKILASVCLAAVCILPVGVTSQAAYGSGYPMYLNGDTNYELGFGMMGAAYYVDKSSVTSLIYNPPYYRLAANVVVQGQRTGSLTVYTYYFDYNINNGNVTMHREGNTPKNILNLKTSKTSGQRRDLELAMITWKAAYGTEWNY